MPNLTLYKTFYKVSNGETYNLLTPSDLLAITYDAADDIIETLTPQLHSTGIYYIEANINNYNVNSVYKVNWFVEYITGAPEKIITNYFRFNLLSNVSNRVIVEVHDSPILFQVMQKPIVLQMI